MRRTVSHYYDDIALDIRPLYSYLLSHLAHLKDAFREGIRKVGASAVPAGGKIRSALGRLGHQSAGTMTGAGGAPWTGTGDDG